MQIPYEDPNDFVTEVTNHTCKHHKRQPWDVSWPGCTCSANFSRRRATPEEKEENIRRKAEEFARRQKHMEDYDKGLIN